MQHEAGHESWHFGSDGRRVDYGQYRPGKSIFVAMPWKSAASGEL